MVGNIGASFIGADTSAELLIWVAILWDTEINKLISNMWGIQNSCIGTMGCGDAFRIGAEVDSESYCIGADGLTETEIRVVILLVFEMIESIAITVLEHLLAPSKSQLGSMVCGDAYFVGADAYAEPLALWKLISEWLYSKFWKSLH